MSSENYCKMTKQEQVIKEGTKTVWIDEKVTETIITEKHYNNIVSKDTRNFFRSLGGSEYIKKNDTPKGKKIIQIISTRPDKEKRSIYSFDFHNI